MTRKDFNAIAAAFAQASHDIDRPDSVFFTDDSRLDGQLGLIAAASRVADVLAASNPNFDRARFMAAVAA